MKVDSNALITIMKELDAMNVHDTNILPEDGSWKFYARDPAGVSAITAALKTAAFPEGESLEGEISISVPFMLDVLQANKTADISVKDGSIIVKYDNAKRSKRLVDPEEMFRKVPQLDGLSTCVLTSDDIIAVAKQKCFDNIKTESGGVTLTMTETGLKFNSTSEVESAELTVEGTSILEEGDQEAMYPTSIIFPLLKTLPKGTPTSICFKTDFPLVVSIDEDMYSMDLYMAPMMRQE